MMDKSIAEKRTRDDVSLGQWDRFWFSPGSVRSIAFTRGLLCMITAAYFVSCWSDVTSWYTAGRPLSPDQVASFLQASGLNSAARWNLSPLFLVESVWGYRAYLSLGVLLSLAVATGRGGRAATWGLWLLLVGWANRAMILSSLTESTLCLGLFAVAIAPPGPMFQRNVDQGDRADRRTWSAGFANRLLTAQATVLGIATVVTMLAGTVWFNGTGAYALAAPVENRTIDWTQSTLFQLPIVYETLAHLIVIMMPVGLILVWRSGSARAGKIILALWCLVVGSLSSEWLYAATLATMFSAIDARR